MKVWSGIFLVFLLIVNPVKASGSEVRRLQNEIFQITSIQRNLKFHLHNSSGLELIPVHIRMTKPLQRNQKGLIDWCIREAAREHQLPPSLLNALIRVESNFNPKAYSKKGCIGLTQLHPGTAAELRITDPWDIKQNVFGGAAYLRQLYDKYGSVEHSLWSYNAGPGRLERGVLPKETRKYVRDVMRYWRIYQKGE